MEVYEINGPLDPTCFFKFIGMKGMWPWLYEPFVPQRPLELPDDSDLFAAIREMIFCCITPMKALTR